MKPVSAFDNYPPFATNGARTMNTESAKYSVGFVPADTFPAEWANYLFHGATKGVSDLNTALTSVWSEAQCVITCAGMTPDSSCGNQLATAIQTLINNAVLGASETVINAAKLAAHPVGSLYWSSDPTDPSQLFGGTWTAVKDKFVWAKGDSDTVNATGGEKTHTLTVSEMPSHNHNFTPAGSVSVTSNPTFSGSSVTSSGMSGDSYASAGYQDDIGLITAETARMVYSGRATFGTYRSAHLNGDYGVGSFDYKINLAHTHSVTAAGSISGGAYKFTGSAGTTGNKGSDTAHNNMPPYIIKYCWERIA